MSTNDDNEDQQQEESNSNICPICLEGIFYSGGCASVISESNSNSLDVCALAVENNTNDLITRNTRIFKHSTQKTTEKQQQQQRQAQQALGTTDCGHVFHYECFTLWRLSQIAVVNNNNNGADDNTSPLLTSSSTASTTTRYRRQVHSRTTRVKCPTCNKRTKSFVKLYISPPPQQQQQQDQQCYSSHHHHFETGTTETTNQIIIHSLQKKLDRRKDKCVRYRNKSQDLQSKLDEIRTEMETIQSTCQSRTELATIERTKLHHEIMTLQDHLTDQLWKNQTLQQHYDQMLVSVEARNAMLQTRCTDLEQLLEETRNSYCHAIMELTMEFEASQKEWRTRTVDESQIMSMQVQDDGPKKSILEESQNLMQRIENVAATEDTCSMTEKIHKQQQQSMSLGGDDNKDHKIAMIASTERDDIVDLYRRVQLLEVQLSEEWAKRQYDQGNNTYSNIARSHLPISQPAYATTIPATLQQQQYPQTQLSQSQQPVVLVVESTTTTTATTTSRDNKITKKNTPTSLLKSSGFICRHGMNPIFYR